MIAIIDYGAGNLHSVQKAFEKVGHSAVVTRDAAAIRGASHAILPGVGAFGDCVEKLERSGLKDEVLRAVSAGKPILGICVGMQMLFEKSEENAEHSGLCILPDTVARFDNSLIVPHMGWNKVQFQREIPLFSGIPETEMYFVHSYRAADVSMPYVAAVAQYGGPFVAAVAHQNLYGTQFHPEKSGDYGLRLLKNFAQIRG